MIKKPLMKNGDGRRHIPSFNLIDYSFIVIRKSIEYEINLILVGNNFSQDRQLVKASRDTLKVYINSFGFLLPAFRLSLQLLYMPSTGFCIGSSKGAPNFE